MKMIYFSNINFQYNRVIFKFTDEEKRAAGFHKLSKQPTISKILRLLNRISDNGSEENMLQKFTDTKTFGKSFKDTEKTTHTLYVVPDNEKKKILERRISSVEQQGDDKSCKLSGSFHNPFDEMDKFTNLGSPQFVLKKLYEYINAGNYRMIADILKHLHCDSKSILESLKNKKDEKTD